jgi:hypothetical protein
MLKNRIFSQSSRQEFLKMARKNKGNQEKVSSNTEKKTRVSKPLIDRLVIKVTVITRLADALASLTAKRGAPDDLAADARAFAASAKEYAGKVQDLAHSGWEPSKKAVAVAPMQVGDTVSIATEFQPIYEHIPGGLLLKVSKIVEIGRSYQVAVTGAGGEFGDETSYGFVFRKHLEVV